VKAGAVLVGIDSLNIDDTGDGTRPVHSTLLAAEIPIVEHLRGLGQLPDQGFSILCGASQGEGHGNFPRAGLWRDGVKSTGLRRARITAELCQESTHVHNF
jgi:hypothetical protein